MSADRCPDCDRPFGFGAGEVCDKVEARERALGHCPSTLRRDTVDRMNRGMADCAAHRVDWRAEALRLRVVVGDVQTNVTNAETKIAAAFAEVRAERDGALDEVDRLRHLINTPRTDEFFAAVRIESAHQIERWGVEHDAGKRTEDWITLFTYLLGKAAKAYWSGDEEKLKHHVITSGAVALNWFRRLTGDNTLFRPGIGPKGSTP